MLHDYFALFRLFLWLGCVSFGGPTAHFALFQKELIEKRQWMSERQYIQLMTICQVISGPSSSQIGMALGFYRAGIFGAWLAWLGFTLPSAIILALIGIGVATIQDVLFLPFIDGIKIAVLAVVANAIISMCKQMCTTKQHYFLVLCVVVVSVWMSFAAKQIVLIALAALFGMLMFRHQDESLQKVQFPISKCVGICCITLFFWILLIVPILMQQKSLLEFFYIFYQAGALVFGGGHVVLPLLEPYLLYQNWVSQEEFLAGYGIVQAMPGPLFNFSSYLGAVAYSEQPILGALVAVIGIFLPAALILFGVLPFMGYFNQFRWLRAALMGSSVGVIGLLIAALYDPIFMTAISNWADMLLASVALLLLYLNQLPVWLVVLLCGLVSSLL